MTPFSPKSVTSHDRDQARYEGLRRLFRSSEPETDDNSDEALVSWLIEASAGEDQLLAHRLRRDLEQFGAPGGAPQRAAE